MSRPNRLVTPEQFVDIICNTLATLDEREKAFLRGEKTDLNPNHRIKLVGWNEVWIQ